MYVQTLEFRAFTTIFRSVGPVISTLRSIKPGAGGAPLHASFSRICFVSGRKSGSWPLSSSACLITRRWRSSLRVPLKDRWRRARKARASLLRIFLLKSVIDPATFTPCRIVSVVAILNYISFGYCSCFVLLIEEERKKWLHTGESADLSAFNIRQTGMTT